MDNKSENTVLTVAEAAAFLRVSESIVRRLIKEKRIPFFQIEGRYLLFRPKLEEWIVERTVAANGGASTSTGKEIANKIWNTIGGQSDHGIVAKKEDAGG